MNTRRKTALAGLLMSVMIANTTAANSAIADAPAGFQSTLSGVHLNFGINGRLSTTQAQAVTAAQAGAIVTALPIQIKKLGPAMKAANPAVRLFAYQNGMFAQSKDASTFPSSWYLKTAGGQKVQAKKTGNYLMNPFSTASYNGAAGWTAYVVQRCKSALSDPNTTGCFLDQMNAAPLGSGFVNGAPVDPRTGKAFTRPAYMSAVAAHGQAVASRLAAPVIGNAYDSAPRYYSIPTNLMNAASTMGVFEAEHWFGNDVMQARVLSAWQQAVQMEMDAQAANHGVIVNVDGPGSNVEQWRRYLVASYLLGNNGAAWFQFGPDPSTAPYSSLSPLYDMSIGTPLETASTVAGYAHGAYYRRAYTGGVVLVNPSSSAVTVALGGTFTDETGASMTSITLQPWSGAVLAGSGAAA